MPTTARPFLGTDALSAGLVTRRTLISRHRRIFRNVYIEADAVLTPVTLAEAAWLFAGRNAVLAGISAAALHGDKWLDLGAPELMRADAGCQGLVVHRRVPEPGEVCTIMGMSVTTAARTAFDLGRRAGATMAAVRLDALANATGVTAADVEPLVSRHRGARGLVQLRSVLAIMDGGAESPQETRTRLTLLKAGLPRPQTQIAVRDDRGYPYARVDMGYEEVKVGVEYDGEQHWTDPRQRAYDIERHIALSADGWAIIRVSSDLLRNRPRLIVGRVVEALRAADCPWLGECAAITREPVRRVS